MALCVFASDTSSSWPVVLVHGLMGFVGEVLEKNYWGDVPEFLEENGATVLIAELSPTHESMCPAQQLYAQLKQWGYNKYHLICHSQGGKDARVI